MMLNKGACIYTQPKAEKALLALKTLLLETDYNSISIAHSHYLIGEGGEELMQVCKGLKTKYS